MGRQRMRKLLILSLLLLPSAAFAQTAFRYQSQIVQTKGLPLANQSIAVCSQPADLTTTPCSPLVTLATSATTSTGGPNPLTSDTNGNFFFYAVPGTYTVQIYGPQIQTPYVITDIILGVATVATLTVQNAGVFTNTPGNEYNQTLIHGLNILTEFQAAQGGSGNFPTEAVACGIAVPSTSTVYQANCGADYLTSLSQTTNSVARYSQARAGANSVKVWAINPVLIDYVTTPGSTTGANLLNEFDAVVTSASTTGQLLACSGIFTAQPSSFPCLGINAPGASGDKWSNGINFATGSVLNSGIHFGVAATGNDIGIELDQA